jgi:LytS/YehU family sensor histidine kinase
VAALLVALVIAFFLRQQSLKHKQKILETEQRLNRARMNPHFFFNALASLQSFAIRENDGQAIAVNLSRFSHIMRETLESTYKEYVTVEQEIDFLQEYLEVQKIRFPKKFSFLIEADPELETDEVQIPAMIIQPFVENSVEHGFSGIDYTGEIKVYFSKKGKELLILIEDNGKGIGAGNQEKEGHVSRASQIIRDRIYLLNLKLRTKASFSINNTDGQKGVQVKIYLPLLFKEDI